MAKSIPDTPKKRGRGRPSTGGRKPGIMVRLENAQMRALNTWISVQPNPQPSRPEAIRRLVEKALANEKGTKRKSRP